VRLGSEADKSLTTDVAWITTALNVRRDRKIAPTLNVTTTSGERIHLEPGGFPRSRDPGPPVVEERDGKRHVRITVPLEKMHLAEHMTAKALKDLGLPKSAIRHTEYELRTVDPGDIEVRLAFGGPDQFRAVAKIALSFLAYEIGDRVFEPQFASLRRAVDGCEPASVWRAIPLGTAVDGIPLASNGAQHRVVIFADGEDAWAHIEVYGAIAFSVLLSEKADRHFDAPYAWVQDPTTGAQWAGRLPTDHRRPVAVRVHAEASMPAFTELLRFVRGRQLDDALRRTIEEELQIAAARNETGEMSDDEIWQVSARIAERAISLYRPKSTLDLTLKVDSLQQLVAIRDRVTSVAVEAPDRVRAKAPKDTSEIAIVGETGDKEES
jgi:hypothetical protein